MGSSKKVIGFTTYAGVVMGDIDRVLLIKGEEPVNGPPNH
jgi:hypothetical protein